MKITIFTGNQPRHFNLVKQLAEVADEVFCIQETLTVRPGLVDDFFRKSEIMQRYFGNVMHAEKLLFGGLSFMPKNVRSLCLRSGDLIHLTPEELQPALEADMFIVFGSSYIKGWLCDYLVKRKAINIHMGLSPYYRGSSCNFWALHDRRPSYVGATIHLLSQGLDNGDILFHCLPKDIIGDPFLFTMKSVEVAQTALKERIRSGEIHRIDAIAQDPTKEKRYSRNKEFDDNKALAFLEQMESWADIIPEYPELKMPWFG
ncbi:MAG: methionyl-tRNA formyltransferase [Rhodospirillaceae bacterium]|nr:methionyl-tRNA formyltransferase [Rhodospirillaceae bacterium]|tara:strand:- start:1700 stop:2479 length:780 start_codon:yes stop_codon:yes gene_type:complete